MISLMRPFSTVAFIAYFFVILNLYHLIFRDISLKSQESFALFFVAFHLIFSGFYLFQPFSLNCSLSYPIIFVIYSSFVRLFIRYFIGFFLVIILSLELFSCPYLFIYFVFLFLLNCANSVLCAV